MAIDVFLKIDGISGESTDPQYRDWIEVLSLNWAIERPMSGTQHTLRSTEFGITKVVDKASTQIVQATVRNENIREIRLAFCRAGQEKVKYLEYIFRNCAITKFALKTGDQSGESLPMEELQFRFASVEITYFQQTRDSGGSRGQISTMWNVSEWGSSE